MRRTILSMQGAASMLLATTGLAQGFAAIMKDDLATWVGLVKAANLKPE